MPKTMEQGKYDAQSIQAAVYQVIANTFSIDIEQLHPELAYQSIYQWDSMAHINLMLALEENFNLKVSQNNVLELVSIDKIVNYVLNKKKVEKNETSVSNTSKKTNKIFRGLNNVYFDQSTIACVDPENSQLFYRGYSIEHLVKTATYEEVAYLLIHGNLPNQQALETFTQKLRSLRDLSDDMLAIIDILAPKQTVTHIIRTLASALSETLKPLSSEEQGLAYLAKLPTIIGACCAFRQKEKLPVLTENASQAEYFLSMLLGRVPDPEIVRVFEQNMILQAEHDSNASTFSARVTISADTDLGNAMTSAIATLPGWLHGGALFGVVQMLEEIQDVTHVKSYIQDRLKKKLPVFGFGHRVYRKEDPRSVPLKNNAEILVRLSGDDRLLKILDAIKGEMQAYMEHGMHINADFYACVSYLLMGISKEMLVPIFMANRCAGWIAHILEQKKNNILLRPRLDYTGEKYREFVAIEERI